MISMDHELKKYLLSNEEWENIKEIEKLLEVCIYIKI
jgi:hypothetical protein